MHKKTKVLKPNPITGTVTHHPSSFPNLGKLPCSIVSHKRKEHILKTKTRREKEQMACYLIFTKQKGKQEPRTCRKIPLTEEEPPSCFLLSSLYKTMPISQSYSYATFYDRETLKRRDDEDL
jgi:hypothetical protein